MRTAGLPGPGSVCVRVFDKERTVSNGCGHRLNDTRSVSPPRGPKERVCVFKTRPVPGGEKAVQCERRRTHGEMSEASESRHDSVLSFSRGGTLLMLWPHLPTIHCAAATRHIWTHRNQELIHFKGTFENLNKTSFWNWVQQHFFFMRTHFKQTDKKSH